VVEWLKWYSLCLAASPESKIPVPQTDRQTDRHTHTHTQSKGKPTDMNCPSGLHRTARLW
jgi:hypothetical protein